MSHYDHLDPAEIGKKAWKAASRAAKHMSKHSRIVNPALEKCIPRFERSEVVLGEFLGSGGFNDVYEIKRVDLVKNLEDAEHAKKIASPLQQEHREFIAKHVFRESSQNCRYAMKFLSVDTIGDPGRFCTGAADLVVVCTTAFWLEQLPDSSYVFLFDFYRKLNFLLPWSIPISSSFVVWLLREPPDLRPWRKEDTFFFSIGSSAPSKTRLICGVIMTLNYRVTNQERNGVISSRNVCT